jgi:PKD repeat protein
VVAKLGQLRLGVACLALAVACVLPARAKALVYSPSVVGSPAAAFTVEARSPEAGQLVSFDGSSSSDTGASIVTYAWRFGDGARASGAQSTHTYSTPGSYSATLTVTDSSGQRSAVSHEVVVGQGPAAAFAVAPSQPFDRAPVAFDATSSTPGALGGEIETYTWSFGDGSTAAGATATHTYGAPGTYTVKLTVVDGAGAQKTASRSVVVADQPPAAAFAPPPGIMTAGQTIALDGAGSSDAEGAIASYAWSFGDGATATGKSVSHVFGAPGTYSVSLTVRDSSGQKTTTTHDLAVHAPPQAALAFSPALPRELSPTTFDAGVSVNPDASTTLTSYRWSFGDGAGAAGALATHTYARAGTYAVRLAVTDALGLTDTITHEVTVAHGVPTAAITIRSAQLVRGQQVHFTGSASYAPDEPTVTYTWRFGDGGSATGRTPVHTYARAGRYVAELTVSDSFGDQSIVTATVVVARAGSPTSVAVARRRRRARIRPSRRGSSGR